MVTFFLPALEVKSKNFHTHKLCAGKLIWKDYTIDGTEVFFLPPKNESGNNTGDAPQHKSNPNTHKGTSDHLK